MLGGLDKNDVDLGRRRVISIDEQGDALLAKAHPLRMSVRTDTVN